MFHLQRNPMLLQTANLPIVQEAVHTATVRLEDSTKGLTFNAEEHRYFLYGKEMRSVSSIVEHFAPFDAMATAIRCSANKRHQYYGVPPEQIVAIWKEEGRQAAEAGTQVHAFGEACYHYMLGQEDQIEPEYRDRITTEGFAAISAKEEACARWWAENDWARYALVAKETRIVNPELRYAGTFDLMLYDLYNINYLIKDYKTNKDLDRWFGDYQIAPLSVLKTNDIGKYTTQQTLYTIEVMNIGLHVGSNQLIWLREDRYQTRDLPLCYDRIIAYAVRQLNYQN